MIYGYYHLIITLLSPAIITSYYHPKCVYYQFVIFER